MSQIFWCGCGATVEVTGYPQTCPQCGKDIPQPSSAELPDSD